MSTSDLTSVDIGAVLDTRSVWVEFQPIVDLRTMQVAGLEAFVRGPVGTALESPGALFAAAGAVGRVAELDWAARAAGVDWAVKDQRKPGRQLSSSQKKRNRKHGSIRARVEHVFRVLKQVFSLLALANLYLARRRLADA